MSKLTVSEPWDFVGPGGGNELNGKVIRRLDEKMLLFKTDNEVSVDGLVGQYWVLSARYVNQHFDLEPFSGTVNGSILTYRPSEEDNALDLKKRAVFVVIGNLDF